MTAKKTPRNAQITTLARAGIPYGKIAALYGITKQRVYSIARAAGVSRNPERARHDWATRRAARAAEAEA